MSLDTESLHEIEKINDTANTPVEQSTRYSTKGHRPRRYSANKDTKLSTADKENNKNGKDIGLAVGDNTPVAINSDSVGDISTQSGQGKKPRPKHRSKKPKAASENREKTTYSNEKHDETTDTLEKLAAAAAAARPQQVSALQKKSKPYSNKDLAPKSRVDVSATFTEDERRSLALWKQSTMTENVDTAHGHTSNHSSKSAPLFKDPTRKKEVNVVNIDAIENTYNEVHRTTHLKPHRSSGSKSKRYSDLSHIHAKPAEEIDYNDLSKKHATSNHRTLLKSNSIVNGPSEHGIRQAGPEEEIDYSDLNKKPTTQNRKPRHLRSSEARGHSERDHRQAGPAEVTEHNGEGKEPKVQLHGPQHASGSKVKTHSEDGHHPGKPAEEFMGKEYSKRSKESNHVNLFRKSVHRNFMPASKQQVNIDGANKQKSDSDNWRETAGPPVRPASDRSSPAPLQQRPFRGHPDDFNPRGRRERFKPYMPEREVTRLLASKQLYKGTIRINRRNRNDAYVTSDDLDYDVYIHGLFNRNRALEGDIVAIELSDVEKVWATKKAKDEQDADRKKEQNVARKGDREIEIIANENEDITNDDEEEEKRKPKYCGVVVAILDRSLEPTLTGTIALGRPMMANDMAQQGKTDSPPPKTFWIKPTDKRMPLVTIPIRQCPPGFVEDESKYKNKIFIARITKWSITELHPIGTLVKELGNIGELEIEAKALLAEHNVNDQEFPAPALACLPETPWHIPAKEFKTRRDLRFHRIFTIDPQTAKDLDDAVHVTDLGNGMFEVGVHIADVSFFINSRSALDKEARSRGTSVYLVDRVIPMLPSLLCEQLCSLNPGVERLAFSVIWQMDEYGKIHDTWFGRTIIRSCAKLAYEDAQKVIEGKPLPENIRLHGHDSTEVQKDILDLFHISKHLRKARFDNGSLSMNSVKLSFDLDDDGKPVDVHVYEQKDANRLIEEFMLCANISVAKKIASQYPEQALLRRHAPPIERRLEEFLLQAEGLGYVFDGSSAGALQASFNEIESEEVKETLLILAIKPMQRAKYFCTGFLDITKYMHYALNVPMYTHFTSPIRRYADVIVHRQLDAAISNRSNMDSIHNAKFPVDSKEIAKIAQQCNIKKDGAKNAQDASIQLYLTEYIHRQIQLHGPMYCDAIVIAVLDNAYDIFVPEYGIEKRLHLDRMALKKSTHNAANHTLILKWREDVTEMTEPEAEAETIYKSLDIEDDEDLDGLTEDIDKQLSLNGNDDQESSERSSEVVTESTVDDSQREDSSAQVNALEPPSSETDNGDGSALSEQPSAAQDSANDTQIIKVFGRVKIRLDVDMERTPPIINVHSVNPTIVV